VRLYVSVVRRTRTGTPDVARGSGTPTKNGDLLRIVDRSRIAPQAVIVEGRDAIMDTGSPRGSRC
jgi:hypothetical protein